MASTTVDRPGEPSPEAPPLLLPNVVIAGAPKSGTSSVFYWLQQHPQVLASVKKETQFLMDRDSSTFRPALNYHDHGLTAYARHFEVREGEALPPVVLEATPGYLYQETALRVFAREMPDTRLIFILREPARRLLSAYQYFSQNRRDLDRRLGFAEFLDRVHSGDPELARHEYLRDAIQHGAYVNYLRRWAAECGRERMLVYVFEDLQRDPRAFMQRLSADLGIDPGFFGEHFRFVKENYSYKVRWQGLHSGVVRLRHLIPKSAFRQKLKSLYHRLNTDKGKNATPGQSEQAALEAMKSIYRAENEALAREFQLDLRSWE